MDNATAPVHQPSHSREFANRPLFVGDLTIQVNGYDDSACITIKRYGADARLLQGVTLSVDEFEWITGGEVNHPQEGKFARIECRRLTTGGWRLTSGGGSNLDEAPTDRWLDISMDGYQKLFARKKPILDKLAAFRDSIKRDGNLTLYREMVMVLAAHLYNLHCLRPNFEGSIEGKRKLAAATLDSVNLGVVRAIFAANFVALPEASSVGELIVGHRDEMVERVVRGCKPSQRVENMFKHFIISVRGALEVYDLLCYV